MFIDGTHNFKEAKLRVVILDHNGNYFEYSLRMDFQVSNNITKCEASIFGVLTLKKLKVNNIILHRNSPLVVNQYIGAFESKDSKMRRDD